MCFHNSTALSEIRRERGREAQGTIARSLLETGDAFIRNIMVKKLMITTGWVFLSSEVYINTSWVFRYAQMLRSYGKLNETIANVVQSYFKSD